MYIVIVEMLIFEWSNLSTTWAQAHFSWLIKVAGRSVRNQVKIRKQENLFHLLLQNWEFHLLFWRWCEKETGMYA